MDNIFTTTPNHGEK